MNLLKHHIMEIYYEKPQGDYVEVHMNINCYGNTSEKKDVYPKDHWEKIKEQGYYMG